MSNSTIATAPSASEALNPSDPFVGPRLQGSNRSAGKGRRRRAVAEQRRAEQELWSHLVRNGEEDIYVAPPTPPISRRRLRRAARRSPLEDWEDIDDDHLDMALALSLSLLEPPLRNDEFTVNSTNSPEHQHLDMSYENLVMLENVKCTAPAALVRSLSGHIFNENGPVSTSPSVDELCTICQVEYKGGDSCMMLPCLHTFHDVCGSEWFMNLSKLCPVCKHDITEQV